MRYHILTGLILTAFLTYLYFRATENDINISNINVALADEEFDYYMDNFISTTFNNSGVQQYRIQAERLTHYPINDLALLENPEFVIYKAQEPPWYISSESARIDTDNNRNEQRIELNNNVVITHLDTRGRELNIYTDFLTIYPETKALNTHQDILLLTQGTKITSTGMNGNLMTNQIELLENVRGTYE